MECGECVVACDAQPPRLLFSCLALLLSSHRDLSCKRSNPISQGRAMSICMHKTNRIIAFEPSCPKRVPVPDRPIGLAEILGMIGTKHQETRPPRRSPCDRKLRSHSRIMKICASAALQACHGGKGNATRPSTQLDSVILATGTTNRAVNQCS